MKLLKMRSQIMTLNKKSQEGSREKQNYKSFVHNLKIHNKEKNEISRDIKSKNKNFKNNSKEKPKNKLKSSLLKEKK